MVGNRVSLICGSVLRLACCFQQTFSRTGLACGVHSMNSPENVRTNRPHGSASRFIYGRARRRIGSPRNQPHWWLRRCDILRSVDTASSKPVDIAVPVPASGHDGAAESMLPSSLVQELWRLAEPESCGLSLDEFSMVLALVGEKVNHGLAPGLASSSAQKSCLLPLPSSRRPRSGERLRPGP